MDAVDKTDLITGLVNKIENIIKGTSMEGLAYLIAVVDTNKKNKVCLAFHGLFTDLAGLSEMVAKEILKHGLAEIDFAFGNKAGNA